MGRTKELRRVTLWCITRKHRPLLKAGLNPAKDTSIDLKMLS
jgi:hypothetical protein